MLTRGRGLGTLPTRPRCCPVLGLGLGRSIALDLRARASQGLGFGLGYLKVEDVEDEARVRRRDLDQRELAAENAQVYALARARERLGLGEAAGADGGQVGLAVDDDGAHGCGARRCGDRCWGAVDAREAGVNLEDGELKLMMQFIYF
jgi:hypothetical protein